MHAQRVISHGAMPIARASERQQTAKPPSFQATTRVRYIRQPQDKNLFLYMTRPPEHIEAATNVEADEVPMRLTDLRTAEPTTLQRHGFELVKFPSGKNIDWNNTQQVKDVYYPEVEGLLKRMTGASGVRVMMHGLRKGKVEREHLDLAKLGQKKGSPTSHPAVLTHIDFTDTSGPSVLQRYLGQEAAEAHDKPWSIVQVWRPLVGPVQDSALGFIDAATVSPDDILPVQLHLAEGMSHEVNYVVHNPRHRWFWTSQMQEDDAYVFVNYTSQNDGRAKYTPHGTIIDESIPADVPIRQSIETRAFVFWDD